MRETWGIWNTSVNVLFSNFLFKKIEKRKKHWKYDLLLSWIICMINCIGVRTDGYVNKHIFIIYCILVFTLCCAVFINFILGYIYSRAYGHSIACKFMQSPIKNGQSSTFFPLWVHNKAVHLLTRPTASVYSEHYPAGGDLVILPRAEGSAGVCRV